MHNEAVGASAEDDERYSIMTNYSTRGGDSRSTLPEILGASALIQTGPGGEVVARTVEAVRQGLRSVLAGIEHLRRRGPVTPSLSPPGP